MKKLLLAASALLLMIAVQSCGEKEKLNADQPAANAPAAAAAMPAVSITMDAAHIEAGHAIYHSTCAPCHGEGGKGDGPAAAALNPKPRDHTNGAYMDTLSNAHLFAAIKNGGAQFGYPTMPAQPQLADDSIKCVIAFVRSLSKTYKP